MEIGDIQTISKIYEDGDILTETNVFHSCELEPVETQEEAYIKNDIEQTKSLGDRMKNLFDEAVNVIKDNPEIMKQLNKSFQKIQDENEDLKIENKNLQAKIDYLRGQISVYERYLDIKKEEN